MTTSTPVDIARYLRPSTGGVDFILEFCSLPDGRKLGDAIAADAWIVEDVLKPIFAVNEDGLPQYPVVYIELGRGHWKTGGGAAVALAEAVLHPQTEVVCAAVDQDQAGLILEALHGYVQRNATLRSSVTTARAILTVPANGSRVRVVSSDVASSYGIGGTCRRLRVILDEITVWPRRELFDSLLSATGKVPDSQLLVFANAGFDPERSWQYQVRGDAEREGHLFCAEGVVASWIQPAWVARMQRTLPPATFERLILNRWASEGGDFVSREQLAACVDTAWRQQFAGERGIVYAAGLDLGLTRDRTALAVAHMDRAGRPTLDSMRTWQGTRGQPVNIGEIEEALIDYVGRFHGLRIWADPWQFAGSIQRLRGQGVQIEAFPFTATSVSRLGATLFEAIASGQLRLYPDAELEAEILGLRTRQTPSGWRVDHAAGGFSDRAMALGLAFQGLQGRHVLGDIDGVLRTMDLSPRAISDRAKAREEKRSGQQATPPPAHICPVAEGEVMLAVDGDKGHHLAHLDAGPHGLREWTFGAYGQEQWVPEHVAEILLAAHPTKFRVVQRSN